MSNASIGLKKHELDTPCLVIDINALQFNLEVMRQHSIHAKVHVRPHCKTHKCSKLAQMQLDYGAIGISCAKISEAEVLVRQGIQNILVTSPQITPYKIARLLACVEKEPGIMVVLDNEKNMLDLNQAASSIQKPITVLVDLDAGIGRTGVKAEEALLLGKKIAKLKWLRLAGIQCYAGQLQHISSFTARKTQSLKVMEYASDVVKQFREHGLPCSILTGTGTGTYDIDTEASEVTEIQPGSYVVMDVEYSAIGSKEQSDAFTSFKPAMTLLTTVISSNRSEHVTVDAGTKAIYVDFVHKPKIISHRGLEYDWGGFGDEHGKITTRNQALLPSNGDVLELMVPHCDPTINLYDRFYITENNRVIDVWDIDLRGKSQ